MLIAALIALVNMLGYGIIIPILYSYSKKFGLTDFQNGLSVSLFRRQLLGECRINMVVDPHY